MMLIWIKKMVDDTGCGPQREVKVEIWRRGIGLKTNGPSCSILSLPFAFTVS
jgi:hypothetical protein